MSGRVIYDSIITSRRFNDLWELGEIGIRAQQIYLLSYILADNWGHLPYDPRWIKLKAIPGCTYSEDEIATAMAALLWSQMWDCLYKVGKDFYAHVFNMEQKSIEYIRKRRKGEWPDESGNIPTMKKLPKREDVLKDIEKCEYIRKNSQLLTSISTFLSENFPEFPGISRNFPAKTARKERKGKEEKNKITTFDFPAVPPAGSLGKIRKSFLNMLLRVSGGDIREVCRYVMRSTEANAVDLYAYIAAGLEQGYIYQACEREFSSPAWADAWIDTALGLQRPSGCKRGGDVETISSILSGGANE